MRYDPIDPELFIAHRQNVADVLPEKYLAVVHAHDQMPTNADAYHHFVQNSDLYYLTGVDQPETSVVLFPSHPNPKMRTVLFLKETTDQLRIWDGPMYDKAEARERTGIETIYWSHQFDGVFRDLMKKADGAYFALNEHARLSSSVETRTERLLKACQQRYPLHDYRRLAPTLSALRQIKSPTEVAITQQACDLTEAGFRRVLDFVKPDVGEWEIEAEFSHEFLRNRSHGFAYHPIVASGGNACILHYVLNNQVCRDGDMILLDVGAEYSRYKADMTRSIPVNGRFSKRQLDVYNAVKKILFAAQDMMQPGITLKELEEHVRQLMDCALIDLGLIEKSDVDNQTDDNPARRPYFMHGTAHHLGLDVHDVGATDRPLEPGMILTCEPGIYIREENLGIRLENDILITENGNQNLMASIPIEPEEIEELMNA